MSCCWRPIAHQQTVRSDGTKTPQPEGNGVVALQAYPGCNQPHAGDYRARNVYIVGWKTVHEKIFRDDRAIDAVTYRNGIDPNLALDGVQATVICDQAVLDLYGPAS